MSDQTNHAAAMVPPTLNPPHKRRRSTETLQSKQFVPHLSADPSDGHDSPVSMRDGKRHENDTATRERKTKAHGHKRRRIHGAFSSVYGNEQHRPSDLEEARPQSELAVDFPTINPVSGGVEHIHKGPAATTLGDIPSHTELVVGSIEQGSQTRSLDYKKKRKIWRDKPQPSKPKDPTPTTSKPLQDVTNIQNARPVCSRIPSKKPVFRAERAEYHHPNIKDFKFPQGVAASPQEVVGEVTPHDEHTPTNEAPPPARNTRPKLKNPLKRKADDDLQREGSAKKLKKFDDQPLPWIVNDEIQSCSFNDFTSDYFTKSARPLPATSAEDVLDAPATAPDDTHEVIDKAPEIVEAQQLPTPVSEPVSNEEPSLLVNDGESLTSSIHKPGNGEPALGIAVSLSSDLDPVLNGVTEDDEYPTGDEEDFQGFGTSIPPSTAVEPAAAVTSPPAPKIIATVPSWIGKDFQHIINLDVVCNKGYDPARPQDYKHHIAKYTGRPKIPRLRVWEYQLMPEMPDVEALNQRLNWVIPTDAEAPHLFREMPTPPPHIESQLARCVRFAQSDAQRRVDWRAHPSHFAEIIQRTNFYGMELLVSRDQMCISSPPTPEEFELAMATQLAHVSFGKDQTEYIAADVPALVNYLMENLPSAICIFPTEEDDCFSGYTDYYREMFAENYPSLDALGLPAWQRLLDGEGGRASLKAQSLQSIIDSIPKQNTEPTSVLAGSPLLEDSFFYEQPASRSEYSSDDLVNPVQIHGVDGNGLDGGFQWQDEGVNSSFLNADQIRELQDGSATSNFCWSNGTLAEQLSDPAGPAAQTEVLAMNVDSDPADWFWNDPNAPMPWDFGQDSSVAGFSAVASEHATAETQSGQPVLYPFVNENDTDEWL